MHCCLKVTKKSDLSDFYFNIGKNVAFGAKDAEVRRSEKQVESKKPVKLAESRELEKLELKGSDDTSDESQSPNASNAPLRVSVMEDKHQGESSILPKKSVESLDKKPITNTSDQEKTSAEQPSSEQPKLDHHKSRLQLKNGFWKGRRQKNSEISLGAC